MAKKQFVIDGVLVSMKDVTEYVGEKVSIQDIEDGNVPDVAIATPEDIEDLALNGGMELNDPLHRDEDTEDDSEEDDTGLDTLEDMTESDSEEEDKETADDMADGITDDDDDFDTKIEDLLAQNTAYQATMDVTPTSEVKDTIDIKEVSTPSKKSSDISPELRAKLALITVKHTDKKKGKLPKIDRNNMDIVFPTEFSDEKAIKKYYKQLSEPQLDKWVGELGIDYKHNDNESINRMRECMAIKDTFFHKEPATKKTKSKYAKYELEDLVKLCYDNDLEIKEAQEDPRILRMYCIMALKKAKIEGFNPEA